MPEVNKNLKFVILQEANVVSLLLLQINAAIVNQYSIMRNLHMSSQILRNIF